MLLNFLSTAVFSAILPNLASAYDALSSSNVVMYWGQNSAGTQQNLSTYCQSGTVDVVLLSFVIGFGDTPTLNFANACEDTYSNGVLNCEQIAADIVTCQDLGVKVLLSLGGASGSYSFASDDEGTAFATTFWNLFGEGTSDFRPFGTSIVDGVDLDIENNNQVGYVAFLSALRAYFDASTLKTYYVSAAPQCPYPDASLNDVLTSSEIDFVFIQFYNNYCSLDGDFNWDTWASYATDTSINSDVRIYLGLPGSTTAAGSGYADISTIKSALSTIASSANFGGISVWDASQAFGNYVDSSTTFAAAIKSALTDAAASTTVADNVVAAYVDVAESATTFSTVNSQETTFTLLQSNVSSAAASFTPGITGGQQEQQVLFIQT